MASKDRRFGAVSVHGYVFYVVNAHNLLVLGSPSRFSCQDLP